MYVSLDALMSGPGKTVLIDRYPKNLALFSFVLVGGLVGIFVMLAGILSRHLHKRWLNNRLMSTVKFAQVITFGILGEVLLFSFFFFWCIADIFNNLPTQYRIEMNFALILLGGGVIGFALSIFFFRRIFEKQMIEASKIVGSI